MIIKTIERLGSKISNLLLRNLSFKCNTYIRTQFAGKLTESQLQILSLFILFPFGFSFFHFLVNPYTISPFSEKCSHCIFTSSYYKVICLLSFAFYNLTLVYNPLQKLSFPSSLILPLVYM